MDRELVNDVAISITHLSLEAKEHFFFVVEHFKIGMIRLLDSLGTALGQLELTGKGLIFSIDVVAAARPSGRLIVRHELSHPTRLVTSLMETKIHNANEILVSGRRLGVYREELTAARDEVRYVRRVFKMDDVPHLLDGFPKPDAKKLEIELVEAGLMKIAKDGKKQALDIGIFDAPPRRELAQAAVQYSIATLNGLFLSDVTESLTDDLPKVMKRHARRYRERQRILTTRKNLSKSFCGRLLLGLTRRAPSETDVYL